MCDYQLCSITYFNISNTYYINLSFKIWNLTCFNCVCVGDAVRICWDMGYAASRLDFERAADLRNKLYALKNFNK